MQIIQLLSNQKASFIIIRANLKAHRFTTRSPKMGQTMYFINSLLNRGVIQKVDNMYQITQPYKKQFRCRY
mgnify:CR=1 FL=1